MKESHLRSLIKAVSWRILGTFVTVLISYAVTRKIDFAIYIGVMEFFAKVGVFYAHERLWSVIPFGFKQAST